jgi:undecaprenyl diphosphate synthase
MTGAPEYTLPGVDPAALPRHVAIIMDGNGRWAQRRELGRSEGHKEGARAVRKVVTRARELGLDALTLYAFSSQNWIRPQNEVDQLMALLVEFCEQERDLLLDKDIRFRVIGQRDRLPSFARAAAEALEAVTANNGSMQLVIALSYGGREEIEHAVRAIGHAVARGELDPDAITSATISDHLWTWDLPDPDLVIRTSGELRVSNFLLWQIAYAEFFIDERCWPDFDEAAFDRALAAFARRDRRFGGLDASDEWSQD